MIGGTRLCAVRNGEVASLRGGGIAYVKNAIAQMDAKVSNNMNNNMNKVLYVPCI